MANPIKYNTQTESNALKQGDFWLGTGLTDKGPTSSTGFYAGHSVPPQGYVIYINKTGNGPSIYTPENDSKLISFTNKIAGTSYTTKEECFNYFAGQTDKTLSNISMPLIPTEDLTLYLDPKLVFAYPRTGATFRDISSNENNGTLTNGPIFNDANYFDFDGTDDYLTLGSSAASLVQGKTAVTMGILFKMDALESLRGLIGTLNYNCTKNLGLVASGDYLSFYNDTTTCWNVQIASYIPTGKWIFAVGTYDGTTTRLYGIKDGSLTQVSGTSKSGATNTFASDFRVMGNEYSSYFTNGQCAQSFVYDKVLSEDEIYQIYYNGPIVTDGLIFAVDANNIISYENGSTTARSLKSDNSGTLTNGVSFSKENGGVLYFDGSNDYVEFTDNYIGDELTISSAQGYTLEAWIKVETSSGTTTNAATIVGQTSSTGYGFQVGVSNSKPRINYGARSTSNFYSSTFEYNEWVHVILVKLPNAGCRGYLNGELDTTFGSSLLISSPSDGALRLGNASPRVTGYYDGAIGPVRIYNRDLSDDEVLQNYNAQKSRFK